MMFVDRIQELAFLNQLLNRSHPGPAQLLLLYGRRRIGKSKLLLHWAEQSRLPYSYWAAEKEGAPLQRRKLYATLLEVPIRQAPTFDSWDELWTAVATLLKGRRHLLIVDELPYAAEADPAMLSALQHAWDLHLKDSGLVMALCGSQVRTMEALQFHQSPLFGRLTGQWYLQPLPFSALQAFLPGWSAEDRLQAYSIVGGVPAYLEWLNPRLTLMENLRQVVLWPGSMFVAEPAFLLYDEVREPQNYLSVLKAIGTGCHTLEEIAASSLIDKAHLSSYLVRLQELRLVERRLPVTLTAEERRKSRRGRYHLNDAWFQFYFRFIAPFQSTLPVEPDRALHEIQRGLSAFVGSTAFETLCRQWVMHVGTAGRLAFRPEMVGSHWSPRVQADVVALDARSKEILIGECKWTQDKLSEREAETLLDRTGPLVMKDLPGEGRGWTVSYAAFSRAGFTEGANARLGERNCVRVDLEKLTGDLSEG